LRLDGKIDGEMEAILKLLADSYLLSDRDPRSRKCSADWYNMKADAGLPQYTKTSRGNWVPYKPLKVVIVGDHSVGKTCMLLTYTNNAFPEELNKPRLDDGCVNVMLGMKRYGVALCDTNGDSEFDSLRPLSYSDASVFIACYSVVDYASYKKISNPNGFLRSGDT